MVCKQLGYQGGFADRANKLYNETTGLIWIRDTRCQGHEDNIFMCSFKLHPTYGGCSHYHDAAVVCFNGKFLGFFCDVSISILGSVNVCPP